MKLHHWILAAGLLSALSTSCVETAPEPTRKPVDGSELTAVKCKPKKEALGGNFSGIAWIGGDDYIIVDDKSETEGFYRFKIKIDAKGDITSVEKGEFVTSGESYPDGESIEYYPPTKSVFIVGEQDNRIPELSLADGKRTGREIPAADLYPVKYNAGLESLSYNAVTGLFWITSEMTLPNDGEAATPENGKANKLRIQSYGEDLKPRGMWFYTTDRPSIKESGDPYVFGVSDMCALDDGRLLVMERESNMVGYNGFCKIKIYITDPTAVAENGMLGKELLIELNSNVSSYANYEGMCLGPTLADGRRVLVLVSDSQANLRGALKDWFLTIKIGGR